MLLLAQVAMQIFRAMVVNLDWIPIMMETSSGLLTEEALVGVGILALVEQQDLRQCKVAHQF
jgi:hypothetical protein